MLPTPIAKGTNQPNTRAGKLKGATPQKTPSGWRTTRPTMLAPMLLEGFALDEGRDAAGGLDDLDHALDLAAGFADVLGLVDGDGDGQLLAALFHGTTQVEQEFHPAPDRQAAPGVVGGVTPMRWRPWRPRPC